VGFVKAFIVGNGQNVKEINNFVLRNSTLYMAHAIPQEKLLEGESDTYSIKDYFGSAKKE